MTRRPLLAALCVAGALVTAGCAGPAVSDYAGEQPTFDLSRYFDGPVDAHGLFTDRSGRVVKRFRVELVGRWSGDDGVLDETFHYSDGSTQRRVWRLHRHAAGRYSGSADDVRGVAEGQAAGNAFRWRYTLQLPVDDKVYDVQFDDWMFLMDDRVVLNRAEMSKFGVRLGEVTLTFHKR